MTTRLSRSTAVAAFLTLGFAAGGAMAQPAHAPSAAASLGYAASPLDGQGYAVAPQRPLTVMGMTGGIELKYPETTGSISERPLRAPQVWTR